MAVPEQTPYIEHTGNGVTTSFALKFQCESKDHLIVLIDDIEPPIATWSLTGGNVVFTTAPAAGKKITLQRNTPFSRTTDYQSYNNSFRPPAVNKDFDWIWLKLQELGVANWLMKQYVDKKDDELKAFLLEEIRKQGVALDQLDEYYNYLMQRLAQIAVDKGWDASFVVDGNETQHQINNSLIRTVDSIADLLMIPNPQPNMTRFVKSRNTGTGKGGGVFVFHEGSVKNDGGRFFATASGSWHRITLETWLNLQWWGVVSDGVTDDQPAIMSAIEAFGDLAFNNMSNPMESAFCTFHLPASDKSTVIKDTVWLLPYMRIIGDSANGGSLATLYENNSSTIETKFPLAENYKWAISTRNYVRATGELTSWDSNYSGSNYDNGIVTACFGSQVKDLVVVNKDTTKRVYGGIRMQNAPQCGVDAYVRGFDIGVYVGGSWRSYVKADTECYKAGVVIFGDSNNAEISTYTHGNPDTAITPMAQQHQVFNGIDGTSGLENFSTWKDKTYGTFLSYCYGFNATLISEYHDVGNLYGSSTGHVSSAYCELNKIGNAFVASAVTIGAVAGVNNVKAFAFGTGSRVDLPVVSPDHYSSAIRDESNSQYNSEIICPVTTNLSGVNVYYKNNTQRVFLSATTGSDANNGMTSNTPVKTIDKALDIISKQVGSDSTVKSSSGVWSIVIIDSSTYTPLVWSTIKNDVAFESLSSTPEIHFGEAIFFAVDCKVSFRGVNVTRGHNNNYQTSTGGIIAKGGDVEVSIINGNTTCLGAPSLVSIDPAVTCNLSLSISGGTCEINNNSRFIELSKTATVASTIRASISQNITGTVETRPDFGVDAPTSNILKAIIVNTSTSAKHVLP